MAAVSSPSEGRPSPGVGFDHGDPMLVANPYPVYDELRATCPVARSDAYGGFWVLSRYDDVLAASLDAEGFSSAAGVTIPPLGVGLPLVPAQVDPPEHRGFRDVLQPALTRHAVERHEPRIREIVRELLAPVLSGGAADLAMAVAEPLPPLVIADLFGLPRADCDYFRQLAQGIIGGGESAAGAAAGQELLAYLGRQIDRRWAEPRDDLATLIATARLPHRALTDEERLGMAQLVVVAGHETTVASIASLLAHLGTVPGLADRLRSEPALVTAAVEESLRLEAPVQNFARTLRRPDERHGVTMQADDRVLLLYGAANRDDRRFDTPTEFRLDRGAGGHLSFGAGVHRCVGAPLARLEMRVVAEEVLRLLPGLSVDPTGIVVRGMVSRVFVNVPATWSTTAVAG